MINPERAELSSITRIRENGGWYIYMRILWRLSTIGIRDNTVIRLTTTNKHLPAAITAHNVHSRNTPFRTCLYCKRIYTHVLFYAHDNIIPRALLFRGAIQEKNTPTVYDVIYMLDPY